MISDTEFDKLKKKLERCHFILNNPSNSSEATEGFNVFFMSTWVLFFIRQISQLFSDYWCPQQMLKQPNPTPPPTTAAY